MDEHSFVALPEVLRPLCCVSACMVIDSWRGSFSVPGVGSLCRPLWAPVVVFISEVQMQMQPWQCLCLSADGRSLHTGWPGTSKESQGKLCYRMAGLALAGLSQPTGQLPGVAGIHDADESRGLLVYRQFWSGQKRKTIWQPEWRSRETRSTESAWLVACAE